MLAIGLKTIQYKGSIVANRGMALLEVSKVVETSHTGSVLNCKEVDVFITVIGSY